MEVFGIGTMCAFFQASGKLPVVRDKLNNLVRLDVIETAVDFSIFAEIPSGPVDFDTSRVEMRSRTSDSVQRRSSGQLGGGKREG